MKKRDIILDFTSLLDVTLIVIFFFVLFSHLENEEKKAITEQKVKELETSIQAAEVREENANELIGILEEEINIIRESDTRRGANMKAMLEYMTSSNIKIILDMEEKEGVIRVSSKNEVIAEIDINGDISYKLLNAIHLAGYTKEDTIFCDFIYDGSCEGTNAAYRNVIKAIEYLRREYLYVYYSETNISVGKE